MESKEDIENEKAALKAEISDLEFRKDSILKELNESEKTKLLIEEEIEQLEPSEDKSRNLLLRRIRGLDFIIQNDKNETKRLDELIASSNSRLEAILESHDENDVFVDADDIENCRASFTENQDEKSPNDDEYDNDSFDQYLNDFSSDEGLALTTIYSLFEFPSGMI